MTAGRPPSLTVRFDRRTTELGSIQRAVYALADVFTTDIRVEGRDFVCSLTASTIDATEGTIEAQFRREVNDQTLRQRISKETAEIRNLIFAVAYANTGLVSPGQATEVDK